MKQYGVKCGAYAPSETFSTLGQAKILLKKLKHADDAYDISRSDGYYKIVERDVGPWTVVPEIFPCRKCGKLPKHWFDCGELSFHVAHWCDKSVDYLEARGQTAMSAARKWNRQYGRKGV